MGTISGSCERVGEIIGGKERLQKPTASRTKANGAEWRELIREGGRQSDPEQFPSVSESQQRKRGVGGRRVLVEVEPEGEVN